MSKDSECLFCKIVEGEIPAEKVYEDDNVLAFLDITPINPGHTLVIPKKHHRTFLETPDETLGEMISVSKKIGEVLMNNLSAEGINIGINTESAAGQLIFHTHIHVMPRHPGDGHLHWKGKPYKNEGEMKTLAKKIQELI